MTNALQTTLGAREAAFLQIRHLSIVAASRGPDNIPAVSRAVGYRLSPDFRQITILFPAGDAHELLACVKDSGALAVIFSLPSSHEAVQFKGPATVADKPLETDIELVHSYRQAFSEHLGELGYPRTTIETMLACDDDELVAVTFTPAAVFSQTPGPNAGRAIGAAR